MQIQLNLYQIASVIPKEDDHPSDFFFSSRKLFTTLMCPRFEDTKLPTNPQVNDQPFGPLRLHSFMASKKKENTLPPLKLSYSYRLASAFFQFVVDVAGLGWKTPKKALTHEKSVFLWRLFGVTSWGDVFVILKWRS